MPPNYKQTILPFALWLMLTAASALSQTPAPATHSRFQLPLTDGTTASAVFLPTLNGQAYLVYATPTGKLGLYLVTPTEPSPTPEPPVPPLPPLPPVPQRLTIVIVEDPARTTQAQRSILADPTWRELAKQKHDFRGIAPKDLISKETGKPPTDLQLFLARAPADRLPWILFATSSGAILYEGPLPATAAALTELIRKHGG